MALYVGLTERRLAKRDQEHLSRKGAEGSFDHWYTDRALAVLKVLEQRSFPASGAGTTAAYKWMDERERYVMEYPCLNIPV